MNGKMWTFMVVAVMLCIGAATVLQWQVKAQTIDPITISNVKETKADDGTTVVQYDVVNEASKGVAVVATVVRPFRGDTSLGVYERLNFATPNPARLQEGAFPEGKIDTISIRIPAENSKGNLTYQISVAYVLFSDGTEWGSEADRFVERMIGLSNGYIAAYRDLKAVLVSGGISALEMELVDGP